MHDNMIDFTFWNYILYSFAWFIFFRCGKKKRVIGENLQDFFVFFLKCLNKQTNDACLEQ